jgi:hypothetical protein
MKRMLPTTQYYFNSGSNSIDFSSYPDFDPKRLLAVINTTVNQTLMYATGGGGSSPTRGAFGGSIGAYHLNLFFDYSSLGFNDSDILELIYDESVGTEEAKASIDIVSGKSGLDVNLLNSSFGGTLDDVMPAPFQDNALSIAVNNGGVLSAPAMNVNNELIVDILSGTSSGTIPISVAGTLPIDLVSFNNGNSLTPSQPLPATPTNPLTGVYQSYGQGATDANTQRVTANINQISDTFFTGTAQSITQNNIIIGGAIATDCLGFRSFSAQLVCSATAGNFIFEGSNDNVSFVAIPVFNQALLTGVSIVSAITATNSQFIYTGSLPFRWFRIRIASSLTGGTVTSYVKLSPIAFHPTVQTVANNVAANLNCTVAGTVTAGVSAATLGTVTSTDIASAAVTTTVTSANIALTNAQTVALQVAVTAVSGTTPILDIVIQETFDTINYFDVYHFQRITSSGTYQTPLLRMSGIGYRVVRTIGGTTPSFTMSLVRISRQASASINKLFINRTIDPNALASSTPSFITDGCSTLNLCVSMNGGGSGTPTFKIQGSEDNVLWYDVGASTVAVAPSSAGVVSYSGYIPKFARAQVTTAGSGTTLSQVCIKGNGV